MQFFRPAVVLGLCIVALLLWGLYHITKRVQTFHRQQTRTVNRGLKARGYTAQPFSVLPVSTPVPQVSFWIIAALVSVILFSVFHPLLPMAPATYMPPPLHHPATALNLPPAYQPAHAQWFEPAKRDHIHWLEDLGSVVSVSAKASWDFWTLRLPTVLESNNTQHQPHLAAPKRRSTDFFHWAWANATCPDPRYIGLPGDYSVHNTIEPPFLLPASTDLCMGAVWRATSAPAHPTAPATVSSSDSNKLFMPIETTTAAAATAVSSRHRYLPTMTLAPTNMIFQQTPVLLQLPQLWLSQT